MMKKITSVAGLEIDDSRMSYFVSEDGKIFSAIRDNKKEVGAMNGDGYIFVSLPILKTGKRKTLKRALIVAEYFLEGYETNNKKKVINHIDHIKTNDNVENLEQVSYGKNVESFKSVGEYSKQRIMESIKLKKKQIESLCKKHNILNGESLGSFLDSIE